MLPPEREGVQGVQAMHVFWELLAKRLAGGFGARSRAWGRGYAGLAPSRRRGLGAGQACADATYNEFVFQKRLGERGSEGFLVTRNWQQGVCGQ